MTKEQFMFMWECVGRTLAERDDRLDIFNDVLSAVLLEVAIRDGTDDNLKPLMDAVRAQGELAVLKPEKH